MYRFAMLVQRGAAHFDDSLIWLGARRHDFQDLAFHVQRVTRARRLGPRQITAQADDAVAKRQATINQKAHRDRSGVPSTGGKAAKYAGLCCCVVQVERLRVKLSGELFDLCFVHVMSTRDEPLAYTHIFEIKAV